LKLSVLFTMIYFLCPFFKTGGPENIHLTVSVINSLCNHVAAKVIYTTTNNVSLYPEIPFVEFGTLADVEDVPTNFFVLPEIYNINTTKKITGIKNCQYILWWMSYINACTKNTLVNCDIPGIMHAFHSYYEYAMIRPKLTLNQKHFFLSDFIADEYTTINMTDFIHTKEPRVCFNGYKDRISKRLCQEANIPFIEICNMEREQVNDVLKKCQVYVDMGIHPGKDHMPREAAMYGCVVITNKCGSAAYMEDVPITEKVSYDSELVPMIKNVFQNYKEFLIKQDHYRKIILGEKYIATANIEKFIRLHNESAALYEGIYFVSNNEYNQVIAKAQDILNKLEEICIESAGHTAVEGNCFCEHRNIKNRLPELIPKQMNLYSCGIKANNVIEIGFNAGHSALLFLLANPNSKVVCFDICEHPYTLKCFEYLRSLFGDRLELIKGDSTVTIPQYKLTHPDVIFDVFHLDGSHDVQIARQDFENVLGIVRSFIVFDDTQSNELNNLLNEYIDKGIVMEISMLKTLIYEHRIVRKLL